MLSKLQVQHYKSLFDIEVSLEPLTVFIGPNGSGKSNICESLAILSNFLGSSIESGDAHAIPGFTKALRVLSESQINIESKFWHGKTDYLSFKVSTSVAENHASEGTVNMPELLVKLNYAEQKIHVAISETINAKAQLTSQVRSFLVANSYLDSPLANTLKKVKIYDFAPTALSSNAKPTGGMDRAGQGIAYALLDILLSNRKGFDELEQRFVQLVPNIQRITIPRGKDQTFLLELVDRYSEHHIPASDISDGTLRILAFLTALYEEDTPSIICFEEIENGVHPWLLHKMMELLKIVSTEGITGKPVQVLITTHSPVLLNYVESHQVRAVELDKEGKTQVHALPTDSVRFQKALDAYDGALGELWFTDIFGGNPV